MWLQTSSERILRFMLDPSRSTVGCLPCQERLTCLHSSHQVEVSVVSPPPIILLNSLASTHISPMRKLTRSSPRFIDSESQYRPIHPEGRITFVSSTIHSGRSLTYIVSIPLSEGASPTSASPPHLGRLSIMSVGIFLTFFPLLTREESRSCRLQPEWTPTPSGAWLVYSGSSGLAGDSHVI